MMTRNFENMTITYERTNFNTVSKRDKVLASSSMQDWIQYASGGMGSNGRARSTNRRESRFLHEREKDSQSSTKNLSTSSKQAQGPKSVGSKMSKVEGAKVHKMQK